MRTGPAGDHVGNFWVADLDEAPAPSGSITITSEPEPAAMQAVYQCGPTDAPVIVASVRVPADVRAFAELVVDGAGSAGPRSSTSAQGSARRSPLTPS